MLNEQDIHIMFYKIYKREIKIEEFEKWLYENQEIEEIMGNDLYFDLLNINYKEKYASEELEKIIYPLIRFDQMEYLRIIKLLKSIVDNDSEIFDVMSTIYNDYCKGYSFLRYLGLSYITSGIVEDIGVEGVKNNLLKKVENYKKEAKRLLSFLEQEEIKIIGEYEYEDYRMEKDRIELTGIQKMFRS